MLEAKVLGKKVAHPDKYDPSVLVAIPRELNRSIYDIDSNSLPFIGFDAWHAYEVSFLTDKGMPVVGVMKFVVSSDSACLVESKSLKLYLNSFNMSSFGSTVKDAIDHVELLITKDLSELLQTSVSVAIRTKNIYHASPFSDYDKLESFIEIDDLKIHDYSENVSLLEVVPNVLHEEIRWCSDLLRSNCKVTFQPDWGSIYIHIEGDHIVTPESLLAYIVSMRNETHFHEEICELVFVRLQRLLNPKKLMVGCVYTRRGGIDICPFRSNGLGDLPSVYSNSKRLVQKTMRQ
ncbi:NADPH-dependent 7-cyano-7-deazaguanine reductase QueF [Halosquirtibacter laminarini]|uniref:NADPH-dependent 7-cyano-7-deazaguanine reductase QueF n=1 Tax=Halosquirtibacter laminarini TaxID=3374600 RepID=A0AC61NL88_9BACT|nr:NADPH-dependent 7-cyano-7-deazaguanine reductase QueF [Prolixibacteraceae bacterium]